MKNRKGFTLVEVLAVISIIGVISVLLVPMMLNALNKSKKILSEYDKEMIIDAGRTYLTDIEKGVVKFTNPEDSSITLNNHTYAPGEELKVYDAKTYIKDNPITVNIADLVEKGYYDQSCKYNAPVYDNSGNITSYEDQSCKFTRESQGMNADGTISDKTKMETEGCNLVLQFECEKEEGKDTCTMYGDGRYFQIVGYSSKIANEDNCKSNK